jgi:hypothetical protein
VQGSGEFPLDMLRYDECFPIDGPSVSALSASDKRSVTLRTFNFRYFNGFPGNRWESFGWKVTHVDGEVVSPVIDSPAAEDEAANS